jgi:hypothetical protein
LRLDTIDARKFPSGSWTKLWNTTVGFTNITIRSDNWNFKNWNGIGLFAYGNNGQTCVICVGLQQVATNGTSDFQNLIDRDGKWNDGSFYISVLAQSASMLISSFGTLIGTAGIVFQLDHINNSTGAKEFKILYCLKVHGLSSAGCFAVHTQKVDTKLLSVPFK